MQEKQKDAIIFPRYTSDNTLVPAKPALPHALLDAWKGKLVQKWSLLGFVDTEGRFLPDLTASTFLCHLAAIAFDVPCKGTRSDFRVRPATEA